MANLPSDCIKCHTGYGDGPKESSLHPFHILDPIFAGPICSPECAAVVREWSLSDLARASLAAGGSRCDFKRIAELRDSYEPEESAHRTWWYPVFGLPPATSHPEVERFPRGFRLEMTEVAS